MYVYVCMQVLKVFHNYMGVLMYICKGRVCDWGTYITVHYHFKERRNSHTDGSKCNAFEKWQGIDYVLVKLNSKD